MARYWIICPLAALLGSLSATLGLSFMFGGPDPYTVLVGVVSLPFALIGALMVLEVRRLLRVRGLSGAPLATSSILAGTLMGGAFLFLLAGLRGPAWTMGAAYGFTTSTALIALLGIWQIAKRSTLEHKSG